MERKFQTAVFFSNVKNGEKETINYKELELYLDNFPEVTYIGYLPEFSQSNLNKVASQFKKTKFNRIVLAGEMPGLTKDFVSHAMVLAGNDPDRIVLADFREHGALINADSEAAKAILACALYGVPFETAAVPPETSVNKNTLVIGGGIAGIQSALDLGDMGIETYLVEKNPSIGGRMAQLDKTFPTNDCAM